MTDKDAFMEQIRLRPKDDTVRLAYADYAEEYLGLEFWPRLIRAQIQQQGDWKYEAWNCSSAAAIEMGLDGLGVLGQCNYDARRKDVRVAIHIDGFNKGARYDVILSHGFPRQLIYGADLRPFVKQAGELFKWPIVSVLTAAKPNLGEPCFTSLFYFRNRPTHDWWTDLSMDYDNTMGILPDALFKRIVQTCNAGPNDASYVAAAFVEFVDAGTAVYALKQAIMAHGREAYKASLAKKPSAKKKKGG